MKKIFLLLLCCVFCAAFSQEHKTDIVKKPSFGVYSIPKGKGKEYFEKGLYPIAKNERVEDFKRNLQSEKALYKKLSIPEEDSWLSKYLRRVIKKKDLENLQKVLYLAHIEKNTIDSINKGVTNVKVPPNQMTQLEKNNIVTLSFNVNRQNKISFLLKPNTIRTGVKSLDSKIVKAFRKIPPKKLGIARNSFGEYSVQLFEYKNNVPFINASSIALKFEKPILKSCEHFNSNFARSNCIKITLQEHIINNISLDVLSKQKERGEIKVKVYFKIDSEGKVSNMRSSVANKVIQYEMDRVLKSFNEEFFPARKNGCPVDHNYFTVCQIFIENN